MLNFFLTFFWLSYLSNYFHTQLDAQMSSFPYQLSRIAIGCILFLCFACERNLTRDQIGTELKKAWLNYLEKDPHFDSSNVHIEVLEVNFFEARRVYNCEFKVHMKIRDRGLDTVGIMTGNVSKTFDSVYRKT
jgi:hypothetical protein